MTEPNVITVSELAREKGVSRQAVYNAIHRGELNTARLGSATVVLRDAKLRSYSPRTYPKVNDNGTSTQD